MDRTANDAASDELFIPDTIYTTEDSRDGVLPSQYYAPGQLGNLALFPELMNTPYPLDYVPWDLEELGYRYVAPVVHPDGRMEGGLHAPEYYAYSPRPHKIDRWEEGSEAIDDDDDDGWLGLGQGGENVGAGQLSDTRPVDGFGLGGLTNTGESGLEFHMGDLVHTDEESADLIRDLVRGTSTMSIGSQPLRPFASRVRNFPILDHTFKIKAPQGNSVLDTRRYSTGLFKEAFPEFQFDMPPIFKPGWGHDMAMAFGNVRDGSLVYVDPEDHSQPATAPPQYLYTVIEESEKDSALHHQSQAIDNLESFQQQSTFVAPSFPMQHLAQSTATQEESREELDHREWEAQLQEAAARQVLNDKAAISADSDYHTARVCDTETVKTFFVNTRQDDLDLSQDIDLIDADATEFQDIAEGSGEDADLLSINGQLGTKVAGAKTAGAEQHAATMEALSIPTHVDRHTPKEISATPTTTSRPKRRIAAKSYKESSDDVDFEEEIVTAPPQPEQLVGRQARLAMASINVPQTSPRPAIRKTRSKAADITFEEDPRPGTDGAIAALQGSSSPIVSTTHNADLDSDAAFPSGQRTGSNHTLDSVLAPGIDVGLHVHPAWSNRAGLKRSAPRSKEESAAKKKAKTDAEDEGILVSEPLIDAASDSDAVGVPSMKISGKETLKKTNPVTRYGKRCTRGDAKTVEASSASDVEPGETPKKSTTKTTRASAIVTTPSTAPSPGKNKFGFQAKPRKAAVSKASAAPKTAMKRGKKAVATPSSEVSIRQTKRASAMETQETNIGKRLRARD
jgi:hypothetical protein